MYPTTILQILINGVWYEIGWRARDPESVEQLRRHGAALAEVDVHRYRLVHLGTPVEVVHEYPTASEMDDAQPTVSEGPTEPTTLEVYHVMRREERRCEYGEMHPVYVYETTTIHLTDRTWMADNGYERRPEPVYEDAEGREYRRITTIDYTDNVHYATDERGLWSPRPPYRGVPEEGA